MKFFLVRVIETAKNAILTFTKIVALRGELEKQTIISMERKLPRAVTAQSVKVTLTGWANYVFDSSYILPSLSELEMHIARNKRSFYKLFLCFF